MNADLLTEFGEPMQYQPQAGVPVDFTGMRMGRDPLENEAMAQYERVWAQLGTQAGQLPNLPNPKDIVLMGGIPYTVFASKPDVDPSSDAVNIYLSRQRALAA